MMGLDVVNVSRRGDAYVQRTFRLLSTAAGDSLPPSAYSL